MQSAQEETMDFKPIGNRTRLQLLSGRDGGAGSASVISATG